jgi:subtilase family serine protease
MVSHGTTPFASSGDAGASSCCNVQYPASDPLVVAVGGTSLTLNADASYASETTWSGSGSGSSIIYSKPSWQQGLGDNMRDAVDVSYDADPATGVLVVTSNSLFQVGGTSAGAPQWAALLDLASQGNSAKYGAVNAQLYKIKSYHDVTIGSNGFFSATAGWDYPTGLGSPDANATVKALATLPVLTVTVADTSNFQGITVATTGALTIDQAASTLSGTVSVTATGTSTGTILFKKSYVVGSLKLQSTPSGLIVLFLLNVAVAPYPLSSDLTVMLNGGTATVSVKVTRQLDINLNGSVDIVDASIMAAAFGSSLGGPAYDPRADIDANGVVNILDFSTLSFFFGAPDFI